MPNLAQPKGHLMKCRPMGRSHPRALVDHHTPECQGADPRWHPPLTWSECAGCQPCPKTHCRVCNTRHTDTPTCTECLNDTRENLNGILELSGQALLAELLVQGVNSEAAMLIGPAANVEAWRNRYTSALFGRIDSAWLNDCRDEAHPLWILGTWDNLVCIHLDHDRTLQITIGHAHDYLNAHLTDLARDEDFAFDEMADDFKRCVSHLQTVLHDQPGGDRANIGCFDCGKQLERKLTNNGFADVWTCQGCRRVYTYAEYNFALRAALEKTA